jgi:hypothetical protein
MIAGVIARNTLKEFCVPNVKTALPPEWETGPF